MTDTHELMRSLCETKPIQRTSKRSQWRPPSETQLDLEKSLTRAIKAFIAKTTLARFSVSLPDEAAHEKLLDTITNCLERAVHEGKRIATGNHERGIISAARNIAGRAVQLVSDIVDTLRDKAHDIITTLFDTNESDATIADAERQLQEWADIYAEGVAENEIHMAVEQTIISEMVDQGVEKVIIVNQPDACQLCIDKAAEGPITVKNGAPVTGEVPPLHLRCKCNTEAV